MKPPSQKVLASLHSLERESESESLVDRTGRFVPGPVPWDKKFYLSGRSQIVIGSKLAATSPIWEWSSLTGSKSWVSSLPLTRRQRLHRSLSPIFSDQLALLGLGVRNSGRMRKKRGREGSELWAALAFFGLEERDSRIKVVSPLIKHSTGLAYFEWG